VKVTVCELSSDRHTLDEEWPRLVDHCRREHSELVVLPEMPFAPWLAADERFDQGSLLSAVVEHESWRNTFVDLVPATVIGTEPVIENAVGYNEGYVWSAVGGYRAAHRKYYLPSEPGFWEASWYESGPKQFTPIETDEFKIGFLICTEMWFTEHARGYGRAGVNILAAPRATGLSSADKWVAGGRVAAVMSGAFCLSSNRGGRDASGFEWGGRGWVIEPEEGDVLGLTSPAEPFLTIDIDLEIAARAKRTYPRYVAE
jgi:N-carbamoylputrescine amidase